MKGNNKNDYNKKKNTYMQSTEKSLEQFKQYSESLSHSIQQKGCHFSYIFYTLQFTSLMHNFLVLIF